MDNLSGRPRDADRPVFYCSTLVFVMLTGISLFYFGFDRYEDRGHNLLPDNPGTFLLKNRNKPQGAPPGTTDGVVRFRLSPKQAIEFSLEAPPAGQLMRLSGRMRTDDLLPGDKPWHHARLLLIPKDIDGRRIRGAPHLACGLDGTTNWTHCSQVFEIPSGAKTLVMRFAHSGLTGTTEVESPTLTAAVVMGWYEAVRYGLMILWFSTALACAFKARLWRFPLGWLIIALSVAILAGVAVPERLISAVIEQGFHESTAISDWLTADPRPLTPNAEMPPTNSSHGSLLGRDDHGTLTGSIGKPRIVTPSEQEQVPVSSVKKFGHAVLFAALGAVALIVLVSTGNPATNPRTAIVAITAITVFAASTEVLQMLTTDRGPSLCDLGIDVGGACAGLTLTWTALRLTCYRRAAAEDGSQPEPK